MRYSQERSEFWVGKPVVNECAIDTSNEEWMEEAIVVAVVGRKDRQLGRKMLGR